MRIKFLLISFLVFFPSQPVPASDPTPPLGTPEILSHIFSFLPSYRDLFHASLTCRTWSYVAKEPSVVYRVARNTYRLAPSRAPQRSTSEDSHPIDFSEILDWPALHLPLENESAEEYLRQAYEKMVYATTLEELQEKAEEFNKSIYNLINRNRLHDQEEFISLVSACKLALYGLPEICRDYFDYHISRLEYRSDLAKLDQQLFTQAGVRGSFNHPDIPLLVQNALNSLVGRIYIITQIPGEEPIVNGLGSGILASLDRQDSNKPLNLTPGAQLNGVISCAHNFETEGRSHLIGAYFVANKYLDPELGVPLTQSRVPLESHDNLLNFLKTHKNSFEIKDYTISKRTPSGRKIFPNNNLLMTQPRFAVNEDIIFARFKGGWKKQYKHPVNVDFSVINKGRASAIKFNEGERYFAIGYPGCPHYDLAEFEDQPYFSLLDDLGVSPLFITSAVFYKATKKSDRNPIFNNGSIKHRASTGKGMSGGPLIKISGNQVVTIKVFGCITATADDEEIGCY
ncbi:MAG: F-box protein [Alphaproteobacteria bacterium]|nr:F-box protein [Alphaproteobacteria bacterium]